MRRETPQSQSPIASIISPFLSTGGLHKPYRSGMMCASYLSSRFSKRRSTSGACSTFPLEQVLLLGAASRIKHSISYKVKEGISSRKGPPPTRQDLGHDPGEAPRP